MHWTPHTLAPTDLVAGPCAWRVTMLADGHAAYVHGRPSLIVVSPADDMAVLEAAAPHLGDLPVLLGVAEPTFARRFPAAVQSRLTALGRERVEALTLHVEEATELKSGGMLQTMFSLRDRGVVQHLGLASMDPLAAEWLAGNTAVRLLGVPYGLHDQAVRWRALARAAEYGMAAVALTPPDASERPAAPDVPEPPASLDALRFALAERERVLPVLDRPLPADLTPMSDAEVEKAWQDYQASHAEPPPLPRGRPPVGDA